MNKITIEMPLVRQCTATQCGYNVNEACHAKAITIGDTITPGCDTYFEATTHSKEKSRVAGVGACKVSKCKYNKDFECCAENIEVGINSHEINCLTYIPV